MNARRGNALSTGMSHGAGMRSLALGLPDSIRTNDYWRKKYPEMVEKAEATNLARLWAKDRNSGGDALLFDEEMAPFIADPFRGTIERRVLGAGETGLTLQMRGSKAALKAAGIGPEDVDLLISCAFFPDLVDVGNATTLARDLGLRCGAWNLESACSSAVVAYETACALVATERYRNILVAVACTYSSVAADDDALSWWLGDGGGAFVVSKAPAGTGFLGGATRHTAETCGAFYQEMVDGPEGPRRCMRASKSAGTVLRDTAGEYVRSCCRNAADNANVDLKDIDFFIFNTPTAWYASFCAKILGIDPRRTLSKYASYGNIGPALMPVTLYHAYAENRIKPGNLVMMYSVGSSSTASASVTRWGEMALGPAPR
jgi:3-oxoacyl-[acyl-carrier-protein] synthase III